MTWIFIPSNCLPVSASLAKDCEPGSLTWAERLAPSLTLNGKLTRPASFRLACKKAAWMQHLSGATSPPLTHTNGLEPWIASLRASRAKTCHLQADAPGLTESAAGCFLKSPALPVIAVRDTSFWRTLGASLLPPPPLWTKRKGHLKSEPLPASWENWPTSGGMRNGRLFQRPTLEPATGGRGGFAGHGAWTTPVATEHQKDRMTDEAMARELVRPSAGMALCKDVRFWATPQARDHKNPDKPESGNYQRKLEQGYTIDLNSQAAKWASPKASDGQHGGPNMRGSKGELPLPSQAAKWATPDCNTSTYSNGKMGPNIREQAAKWPTPRTADTNQGRGSVLIGSAYYRPSKALSAGELVGANLADVAQMWPTPNAMDCNMTNQPRKDGGQVQLTNAAGAWLPPSSPQAQPTQPGQESSSTGPTSHRRLNPAFTEWLMGWPTGWTIAAPSASSAAATASFRLKLATLLASSLPELKGLFDEKM